MRRNHPSFTPTAAALLVIGLTAAHGCASTRPAGEQLSDSALTAKISAKLTVDPEVDPFKIDVDTRDHVVTLRGEVRKAEARAEAERLARDTKGVRAVRNEIRLAPAGDEGESPWSDAWITTKVKAKLTADPEIDPFNIDVDTEDGVVTLSGRVAHAAARREAERLARDTKGVRRVVNEIEVRGRS